jgi:hypothetical protein
MRSLVALLCLLLAGCAGRDSAANETTPDNEASAALTPGAEAVMIGESGPGIAACVARGRVVNLSPTGQPFLPVRAAPFAEAREVTRLSNGARLFVCTRSLDQRWRGVVLPPADHPDADCGVTQPVASAQPYDGPCQSGLVANAFLELSAG